MHKSKKIEVYFFFLAVLLVLILSSLHLHCFAFSKWHEIIDGSRQTEIIFGKAPAFHSDDWLVNIPHCISQSKDNPPFQKYNSLIGDGRYNMIITGAAPVMDITTLFRPHIWGYFISPDFGMAFEWWVKVISLIFSMWILVHRLTENWKIACLATITIAFSPFLQAWSFNCSISVAFATGTLLAFMQIRSAGTIWMLMLSSACFIWFLTAFLLTFYYTPYLITLMYLILFLAIGICLDKKGAGKMSLSNVITLVISLMVVAGIMCYVVIDNCETIAIIKNSEYPGKRISLGSEYPIEAIQGIFRGNILSYKPPHNWTPLNRCEGAGFILFFPLTIAAIVFEVIKRKKVPNKIAICLILYLLFIIFSSLFGLPEKIAKITLMERVPPGRTLLVIGIVDLLLFAIYAAERKQNFSLKYATFSSIAIVLWGLFLLILAKKASNFFYHYDFKYPLYGALLIFVPSILLFFYPKIALLIVALFSCYFTYNTNPVANGGFKFIEENPLSKKICELSIAEEKLSGKKPIWLVYDTIEMPTLLRMLRVRALNGLHAYPQTNLWNKIDPDHSYNPIYNRYSHIVFFLPPNSNYINIYLKQQDIVIAELHPEHPAFAKLNVDFIMCLKQTAEKLNQIDKLTNVFDYAEHFIYKVKR